MELSHIRGTLGATSNCKLIGIDEIDIILKNDHAIDEHDEHGEHGEHSRSVSELFNNTDTLRFAF